MSGPSTYALLVASAALVIYNIALNLVPFPEGSYVPANLTVAAVAVALGRRAGLGWAELGFARAGVRTGAALGLGGAAVVGMAILVAAQLEVTAPLLADERVAGTSTAGVAYWAALRVPLGTAVPEEVVFRGVLLATVARRWGPVGGVLWSSLVFGLWHIGSAIVLISENDLLTGPVVAVGLVGLVVGITTLAGVVFCALRRWGQGLVAPIMVHTSTNAFGVLAAFMAQRAG